MVFASNTLVLRRSELRKNLMDFDIKSFAAILLSHFLFVLYVVWAFVPDRLLNKLGIVYYPSKHWSCSFPIFMIFGAISTIVFIGLQERTMHPRLDSYDSMTDEFSTVVKDGRVTYLDTPLNMVNKKLYRVAD